MIFVLHDLLSSAQLREIQQALPRAHFVDGMQSAGAGAAHAKRNQEVEANSDVDRALGGIISGALKVNNDFQVITIPRFVSNVLVSRYTEGMHYGDHTDNAVMQGGTHRSDMSMTVFLNDPADYDGGELMLNTDQRPESYKLPAGSCVIYPTYFLHRVNPVTRGERVVAVAWIQSQIRDPMRRQILIDLAIGLSYFLNETPQKRAHPEFIRLDKVYNNLKRLWAEI